MNAEDDRELRAGLEAILAPLLARDASPHELLAVEQQARAYYQSQTKSIPDSSNSANSDVPAYPSSFAQIASLIASGQPIPGIKQIPDRINDLPTSQAVLEARKKPWEGSTARDQDLQAMTSFEQPSIRFIFGWDALTILCPQVIFLADTDVRSYYDPEFLLQTGSSHMEATTAYDKTATWLYQGLVRPIIGAPGRVVTLIPSPIWADLAPSDISIGQDDRVWGVCYEIDPQHAVSVRAHLDHREKDGYSVVVVDVWHNEEIVVAESSVYVGHPDAHSFIGPEPVEKLGAHIYASHGPSGANKDYLYHLAAAVRELDRSSHDEYLDSLEREVRKHEQREIVTA